MTALLVGAGLFLVVWLTGGVAPRRQRDTYRARERAQRLERLQVDVLAQEQLARSNTTKAREARARARYNALKAQECEWDAAYWAGRPTWSESIARNVPRLQSSAANELRNAGIFEAAAKVHLDKAAAARKALARATPKVREQAGLAVLAQVCFQGWLARRRKAMLY